MLFKFQNNIFDLNIISIISTASLVNEQFMEETTKRFIII